MAPVFIFYDTPRFHIMNMFNKDVTNLSANDYVLQNEVAKCIDVYQDNPAKYDVTGEIAWVIAEDAEGNVVGFSVVRFSDMQVPRFSRTLVDREGPTPKPGSILEVRVRIDLRTSTNLLETLISKGDTLVRQRDIEVATARAFPAVVKSGLID